MLSESEPAWKRRQVPKSDPLLPVPTVPRLGRWRVLAREGRCGMGYKSAGQEGQVSPELQVDVSGA